LKAEGGGQRGRTLMTVLSKSLKIVGALFGFAAIVLVNRIAFLSAEEAEEKEIERLGQRFREALSDKTKLSRYVVALAVAALAFQIPDSVGLVCVSILRRLRRYGREV
jgi:hypothetical protein